MYIVRFCIFKLGESLLILFFVFVKIYKKIVGARVDEKFKCKVQGLVQKGGCAETFALVLYYYSILGQLDQRIWRPEGRRNQNRRTS